MSDPAGLTNAASRLVGITDEAIRFFQQLDYNTNSVTNRVTQLESFCKLVKKIELQPSLDNSDDQEQLDLTKQILLYCHKVIGKILSHLEWIDNGGHHTVTQQGLVGVYAELNKQEIKNLFEELHREQICLVAFRKSKFKPLAWAAKSAQQSLEYSHTYQGRESEFLDILFVTDPRGDRASLQSTKGHIVEGTCSWITNTPIYRSWLSNSGVSRGLIIQGDPGKGKTMLAIYLTEQLERLAECMSTETVLYFFCNRGNINANSATAVLRGLIWQLCRLRPQLMCYGLDKVASLHDERMALATGSVEKLWQIFNAMIRDPSAGTVTCVLDGLDECDESSADALIDKFSELLSPTNTDHWNVRVLITRRSAQGHADDPNSFPTLCLDSKFHESNVQDVQRYIETSVHKIAQEYQWPREIQDQVQDALSKKTEGSFLWATLSTHYAKEMPHDLITSYLDNVSEDVTPIYEKILLDIPPYHPLTLEELDVLTAIQDSNSETGLENLKACIKHCGRLLATKYETRKTSAGHETVQTIQLFHPSVGDYLLRITADKDVDLEIFRRVPDNDHERLASRCLDIMNEELPAWSEGKLEGDCILSLPYATRFWFRHLRQCPQQLADDALANKALPFLAVRHTPIPLHPSSVEHYNMIHGLEEISGIIFFEKPKEASSITRLHDLQLACLLGITAIVHKLLDNTHAIRYMKEANVRPWLYGHKTSRPRDDPILKIQGATTMVLSAEEVLAMTPLELAVLEGHKQVASHLLYRFPRSSLRPDSGFILAAAISRCEADLVKLLIEAGVPKLEASRKLEGPISTAVSQRRLDLVKFLCSSDESIWAKKDSKVSEITQALVCLIKDPIAFKSDEATFVQYASVLLQGGGSPDGANPGDNGHGLRYWKRAVMEFLHHHGLPLQALGLLPDKQTPLMLCISGSGNSNSDPVETVQFLLTSGASINQTDLRGWTALHHVANQIALGRAKTNWEDMEDTEEYKLYQIASLLIAAGIDRDLEDRKKRTAADILRVVGAPIWNRDMSEYERHIRNNVGNY
ncbi:hypothetical protein FAVG1_06178 [Fusarium avenaceum]|nr:hypothetical protein FAVG1_06178 [Fusarium avenaceum]